MGCSCKNKGNIKPANTNTNTNNTNTGTKPTK